MYTSSLSMGQGSFASATKIADKFSKNLNFSTGYIVSICGTEYWRKRERERERENFPFFFVFLQGKTPYDLAIENKNTYDAEMILLAQQKTNPQGIREHLTRNPVSSKSH